MRRLHHRKSRPSPPSILEVIIVETIMLGMAIIAMAVSWKLPGRSI